MHKHLKLETVGPSSAMELEFLFEDPLLLLAERMNSILMKLRSMTSLLACSVVTKHASSSIP